jgi:hypothetical protein
MELAHQHLTPVFENIVQMLGATPGELNAFAPWAMELTQRLQRAAEEGKHSLTHEAKLLRQELKSMMGTGENDVALESAQDRMRVCRRLWLTGLLDFVDELLESDATQLNEFPM